MNDIEKICYEVYGVGIVTAPEYAIIWAAEKIEDQEKAKSELKRANQIRKKYGKIPVAVPYNHRLF